MKAETLKGLKARYEFLKEVREKVLGNETELQEMIAKNLKDTKEVIANECEGSN